ncbi:MAG: Hpt domain-containing protein [Butyribacter sp.]|nr:Hpt domain-containing protein [bacterium]MDY3853888.1 Hpt domain-containing protein [Butyribacter sp.]
MEKLISDLQNLGCDMEGAMERFLDDEEFYVECYEKVINDAGFWELKDALEEHDVKKSFECAHTLKGVIANMGLTSLYEIMTEMVEVLRKGKEDGVLEKYNKLMEERKKYPQNAIKR